MVTSWAIRGYAGRTNPSDQSGGFGDDPSAVRSPAARLSAKSWISRLAYLVSRSYRARNSSRGVSG